MKTLRYLFLCLFLLVGSGCENTPKPPPLPPLPGTVITNKWLEGMQITFPRLPSTNAVTLLGAAGFEKQSDFVFTIKKYDAYAYTNSPKAALQQAFREGATAKGF